MKLFHFHNWAYLIFSNQMGARTDLRKCRCGKKQVFIGDRWVDKSNQMQKSPKKKEFEQ
jgi:hypothetical protein